MLPDNTLIGVGNPLLDILAKVDREFLKKWGLNENDAILCDEKRKHMFEDMVKTYASTVEYLAGGSTQNSMRVCQWMLNTKNPAVAFMGCIGRDDYGKILAKKAHNDGINTFYQIDQHCSTGTCAVCIVDHHRSLCANLSAAEKFTLDHIVKHWELIENAEYFYIAGFFLTVCPAAIIKIAEHASSNDKCFSMNLSAQFLVKFFKEPMMEAIPYTDVLFGNDDEMKAFAAEHNLKAGTIEEIVIAISNLPKKNKLRPRVVIATQAKDPVVLALNNEVQPFHVSAISDDMIVDTNGAGDAFVGGFLSQYIQDRPLTRCIDAAMWASRQKMLDDLRIEYDSLLLKYNEAKRLQKAKTQIDQEPSNVQRLFAKMHKEIERLQKLPSHKSRTLLAKSNPITKPSAYQSNKQPKLDSEFDRKNSVNVSGNMIKQESLEVFPRQEEDNKVLPNPELSSVHKGKDVELEDDLDRIRKERDIARDPKDAVELEGNEDGVFDGDVQ